MKADLLEAEVNEQAADFGFTLVFRQVQSEMGEDVDWLEHRQLGKQMVLYVVIIGTKQSHYISQYAGEKKKLSSFCLC